MNTKINHREDEMNQQNVMEKVISIIGDILDCEEEILPENSLMDDFGMNSLESMMIIASLEETFQIKISGKMLFYVDTVQDMAELIFSLIS